MCIYIHTYVCIYIRMYISIYIHIIGLENPYNAIQALHTWMSIPVHNWVLIYSSQLEKRHPQEV